MRKSIIHIQDCSDFSQRSIALASSAVPCEVNHLFSNQMHQNLLVLQNGFSYSQHYAMVNLIVFSERELNLLSKIYMLRGLKVTCHETVLKMKNMEGCLEDIFRASPP